jgi:hypothetical protein
MRPVIALTGGPGGGKSTLIEQMRAQQEWAGRFVVLPETVQYARFANISSREKLFQRLVVTLQMALEDGMQTALEPDDRRFILCHRGSLDPLAFWKQRGWPEDEFFAYTRTTRAQHYARYTAVIHLVTAADGAPAAYEHWPAAHRPEEAAQAIALDRWLKEAWSDHPCTCYLDNQGKDWETKAEMAIRYLASLT